MDAIKEMNQLSFNHSARTTPEAIGADFEGVKELMSSATRIMATDGHVSKAIESIWNNDRSSLSNRVMAIYAFGKMANHVDMISKLM